MARPRHPCRSVSARQGGNSCCAAHTEEGPEGAESVRCRVPPSLSIEVIPSIILRHQAIYLLQIVKSEKIFRIKSDFDQTNSRYITFLLFLARKLCVWGRPSSEASIYVHRYSRATPEARVFSAPWCRTGGSRAGCNFCASPGREQSEILRNQGARLRARSSVFLRSNEENSQRHLRVASHADREDRTLPRTGKRAGR